MGVPKSSASYPRSRKLCRHRAPASVTIALTSHGRCEQSKATLPPISLGSQKKMPRRLAEGGSSSAPRFRPNRHCIRSLYLLNSCVARVCSSAPPIREIRPSFFPHSRGMSNDTCVNAMLEPDKWGKHLNLNGSPSDQMLGQSSTRQ